MAAKPLKLGEILIRAGIITEEQVKDALAYKKEHGGRLGSTLIELGFLSEENLLNVLAHQLKLSRISLEERHIPSDILAVLPGEKALKYNVIPVDRKEMHGTVYLLVAMSDPTNLTLIDDLQFITDCRVRPALAPDAEIRAAVERCYGLPVKEKEKVVSVPLAAVTASSVTADKFNRLLLFLKSRGILSDQDYDNLKS